MHYALCRIWILSNLHFVLFEFCYIMSYLHFVTIAFCLIYILLHLHFVGFAFCLGCILSVFDVLLHLHFVTFAFCQICILSLIPECNLCLTPRISRLAALLTRYSHFWANTNICIIVVAMLVEMDYSRNYLNPWQNTNVP